MPLIPSQTEEKVKSSNKKNCFGTLGTEHFGYVTEQVPSSGSIRRVARIHPWLEPPQLGCQYLFNYFCFIFPRTAYHAWTPKQISSERVARQLTESNGRFYDAAVAFCIRSNSKGCVPLHFDFRTLRQIIFPRCPRSRAPF